ncbi:hypothetical protein A6J63_010200 [Yersinia enterocolitica]|nr:hypothetical protein A6J63_010200 [Yersinia enterocolitica]
MTECHYTRHTSSCMRVGCLRSPESLTDVNSSGFTQLPPSCNLNYLGHRIGNSNGSIRRFIAC